MRLRHKRGVLSKLEDMKEFVFTDPGEKNGRWSELFGNDHPVRVELGVGKGSFITTMARLNGDINYVGLERIAGVLVSAAIKRKQMVLTNLFLLLADAEQLDSYFAPGEVDRIYLNFSDPWPKKRHEKRRLTYRLFLEKYKRVLKSGGEIHFKTDDADYFEYSLMSFTEAGFSLRRITRDLYGSLSTDDTDNVMTEYEQKFVKLGKPICYCEAVSPLLNPEKSGGRDAFAREIR